jgi:hypothetical protein
MPRTGGIGSGLWPTPTSVNRDRSEATLEKCSDFRKRNANQNSVPLYLSEAVRYGTTMWHIPLARDGDKLDCLLPGILRRMDMGKEIGLAMEAQLWATPTTRDGKNFGRAEWAKERAEKSKRGLVLPEQVADHIGLAARSRQEGALNPAFVCWLMGFPPEWENSAPTAMPSSRKLRRK